MPLKWDYRYIFDTPKNPPGYRGPKGSTYTLLKMMVHRWLRDTHGHSLYPHGCPCDPHGIRYTLLKTIVHR
jgi:hypothetical protein